jgi:hypothetical protein
MSTRSMSPKRDYNSIIAWSFMFIMFILLLVALGIVVCKGKRTKI